MSNPAGISRDDLPESLPAVSHRTWTRQKSRDQGVAVDKLDPNVIDHDRERAEDTVDELERLGVLRPLRDYRRSRERERLASEW